MHSPANVLERHLFKPREWEQWPFTCHLYFNLSLSMPPSASSEWGQSSPAKPCSRTTLGLWHVVPDLVSHGLSFIYSVLINRHKGFQASVEVCDFHGCLC